METKEQTLRRIAVNKTHPILNIIFAYFPLLLGVFTLVLMQFYPPPSIPSTFNYTVASIPIFFVCIFLEYALCVLWKKKYYRYNDAINSIFMGSFSEIGSIFWKDIIFLVPYAFINQNFAIIHLEEDTWGLWLAMFLCVELGYYWLHRCHHEWNFLWAGHNVHHSSTEFNLTTALRQGLIQSIWGWVFYLPFAFFFPLKFFSFHRHVNIIYQFWIHTSLIYKFPAPIEWIFNTPSHHRVHHGQNSQYIDKNYGGTLIIFDRIFGTFEPERDPAVYGITAQPKTWNPFVIQFFHLKETYEVMLETPGLWNKIRVWIDLGPEYNYYVKNYENIYVNPPKEVPPPLTPETFIKYDETVVNNQMVIYTFIHFVFGVGTSFLFLTNQSFPLTQKIIIMSYFLFFQYTLSSLFYKRKHSRVLECLRLSGGVGIAYWIGIPQLYVIYIFLFFVVSVIWLLVYEVERTRKKNQ